MDRVLPLDPYTLAVVDEPWRNRTAGVKGSAVRHEAFTASMEEVVHAIEMAGLTPDPNNLTQLWQAIQQGAVVQATETIAGKAEIATTAEARAGTDDQRIITPKKLFQVLPQRVAFDRYFTDANPVATGTIHFDNDGDLTTTPSAALVPYSYAYTSRFPTEKTTISVLMNSAMFVTRPAASAASFFIRAKATNAASVERNNVIGVDVGSSINFQNKQAAPASAFMIAAKEAGTTTLNFQMLGFWQESVAAVGGVPFTAYFDDIEMLIIETVVAALPVFGYSD